NRVLEIGQITRALKLMAKDLHVPIILCSQLARGTETRSDKVPVLSDLRDSGTIEQDADVVVFLYRGDYYDKKGEGNQDNRSYNNTPGDNIIAQCSVAKNRHGNTAVVPLAWYGHHFKFISIEAHRNE
ncbi:MAG: replicative DNA helicase, partial [Firmicutes bacterium HGW-Firmicutes-21]